MSLLIGIGYAVTRKGLRGPGTRLDNGLERTPMDLRSQPRPAPQKSALSQTRSATSPSTCNGQPRVSSDGGPPPPVLRLDRRNKDHTE
jgi:hypothetical protein